MSIKPHASIVITTKNEKENIENCLKSVIDQTYKKIEIIVVDNNSSDNTKQIAKHYTKLVFNFGPERSAQRNFGAKKAKGKYLLFLDADMILTKNVVRECMDKINRKKFSSLVIPEKSIGEGYWSSVKAFERSLYEGDSSIEAARFFDKKVFDKLDGYDEQITGPEDWDLPKRLAKNYKIGRIKSYIIHNENKSSLIELVKKKYYYGIKTSKYINKHPLTETAFQAIYFLRPAFYRNWKKIFSNPNLSLGMFVMLSLEQIAGFAGFLEGKLK